LKLTIFGGAGMIQGCKDIKIMGGDAEGGKMKKVIFAVI
jgi:hypothetical protein